MVENYLNEIHSVENLENAILHSVTADGDRKEVTVKIITDKTFAEADRLCAEKITRKYVPVYFSSVLEISKLAPDCEMVAKKIIDIINENFKTLSVTVSESDIAVEKKENGFEYEISLMDGFILPGLCEKINGFLKKSYCGNFNGKCVASAKNASDITVDEEFENTDYEIPIRYFDISDFSFLEGETRQKTAVYLSDLNFESENVVVCGEIEDINERSYVNKKNQQKTYYSILLNDKTSMLRITYFTRQKSIEKIQKLKAGDGIVCTGKTELFKGCIRFTAERIDYGNVPKNFVPEKRISKPVPKYYTTVFPEEFSDISQTDMFTDVSVPECLKGKNFVVFDLETTGLNSSPSSGNMDKIIEIGAFKITDGLIKERFSTFLNPQVKISEEITSLTGITEEMVASAPVYEDVMPDFFKFCDGAILVGHNAAGFDCKFVNYYCAKLGYMLENRVIDTYALAQELLFLPNFKLNTVAAKFGIEFNHHRAADDAYATAKVFIELIKLKKSLPKLQ